MSEQQFTTPQPVRLEAVFAAGEIRISTVDGTESIVTLEGPDELLATTSVELHGHRLVIQQRRKSLFSFFGYSTEALSVEARVPHGSTVKITTASGGATLDGSFAGLEMDSASGDLRVTGELDGDAAVKTVSGDMRLGRVTGNLKAHSVSGDIEAESVEGSVSAQSVSGDVHVGALREGRVNVHSVSGDVELGVAAGTAVDVDASTASGDLSSEVPLSDTPADGCGPTVVIRGNTVSGDFRVIRAA